MCNRKQKLGLVMISCIVLIGVFVFCNDILWKRNITCKAWEISDIRSPSFSVESGYYEEPFILEIKPNLVGKFIIHLMEANPIAVKLSMNLQF